MNVEQEFKNVSELCKYVLENYPECRDNRNLAYFKACEVLGARTFSQAIEVNLNMMSFMRACQRLQNKEGFYPPSDETREIWKKRSQEFKSLFLKEKEAK